MEVEDTKDGKNIYGINTPIVNRKTETEPVSKKRREEGPHKDHEANTHLSVIKPGHKKNESIEHPN